MLIKSEDLDLGIQLMRQHVCMFIEFHPYLIIKLEFYFSCPHVAPNTITGISNLKNLANAKRLFSGDVTITYPVSGEWQVRLCMDCHHDYHFIVLAQVTKH